MMKTFWVCIILTLSLASGRKHLCAPISFRASNNNELPFIITDIVIAIVLFLALVIFIQ